MIATEKKLFDKVRESIIQGHFKEGEYIDLSKLCSGFKVSQVPIREVVIRLAERGLLKWEKKRGFKVVYCDINECLSLLLIIETIFTNALKRLSPLHVSGDQLIEISQKIESLLNSDSPCWTKFTELFFEYANIILSEAEYHLFQLSYDKTHHYQRCILSCKSYEISQRLEQLHEVIKHTGSLKKSDAINSIQQFINGDIKGISKLHAIDPLVIQ